MKFCSNKKKHGAQPEVNAYMPPQKVFSYTRNRVKLKNISKTKERKIRDYKANNKSQKWSEKAIPIFHNEN